MKLIGGKGSMEKGACWMSALNWYVYEGTDGFRWSDHPKCVDPTIRSLCIYVNDNLQPVKREEMIGPYLFHPVGTWMGREMLRRRTFACAEKARLWAIAAFDRLGVSPLYASQLRDLPEVDDMDTAEYLIIAARRIIESCSKLSKSIRSIVQAMRAVACSARAVGSKSVTDGDALEHGTVAAAHLFKVATWRHTGQAAKKVFDFILELCAMGREDPACAKTQEQTLELLETYE